MLYYLYLIFDCKLFLQPILWKESIIFISKVRNRLSQEELLQKCHYKNFCCSTTFSDSKKSMKNGHFSLIIIILLIIVLCTKKWLKAMTRCTNCQLANDVSVSIHFYKYDKQKYFRFDRQAYVYRRQVLYWYIMPKL